MVSDMVLVGRDNPKRSGNCTALGYYVQKFISSDACQELYKLPLLWS